MGVIVWLLIPVAAMLVAMVWTAALSRRERRRADEKWRAARLAERGAVLVRDPEDAGHSTPDVTGGSSSAVTAADADPAVDAESERVVPLAGTPTGSVGRSDGAEPSITVGDPAHPQHEDRINP